MDSLRQQLEEAHEQLLVASAQRGDRAAFHSLTEQYERRLLYFIRRLLGDPSAALDVLQEVWVTVFGRLGGLHNPAAFRTWVYRIAHDRTVDELRRRKRERELLGEVSEQQGDAADDAVDVSFADEDAEELHRAIEDLSAAHREAITLHFLESMTIEQMAEVARCPAGTMKSRLFHAKRLLREILERRNHVTVRS